MKNALASKPFQNSSNNCFQKHCVLLSCYPLAHILKGWGTHIPTHHKVTLLFPTKKDLGLLRHHLPWHKIYARQVHLIFSQHAFSVSWKPEKGEGDANELKWNLLAGSFWQHVVLDAIFFFSQFYQVSILCKQQSQSYGKWLRWTQ